MINKSKILRWLKRLVTVVGTLLLVLLLLAAIVAFVPFSSSQLDARIRDIWSRQTGLTLNYHHATFRLATGSAQLFDIVVSDPQKAAVFPRIGQLHLRWSYFPTSGSFLRLKSLDFSDIGTLNLYVDDQLRPLPDARIQAVQDLLQRLSERSPSEHKAQPPNVRIRDAELRLLKKTGAKEDLLISFSPMELGFVTRAKQAWLLSAKGTVPGASAPSDVSAQVESTGAGQPYGVMLSCDAIDLAKQFHQALPISGEIRGLHLEGKADDPRNQTWGSSFLLSASHLSASHRPTSSSLSAELVSAQIRLNRFARNWTVRLATSADDLVGGHGSATTLTLPSLAIQSDATVDLTSRALAVSSLSVRTPGSSLDGKGKATLKDAYPFECTIHDATLSPRLLKLAQPYLPRDLSIALGEIQGKVDFAGDRNGVRWDGSRGSLSARGFRVGAEGLPSSATMTLLADWTTESLIVKKAIIDTLPSHVAFSGTLSRVPEKSKKGFAFRAEWEGDVASQDLARFLVAHRVAVLKPWEVKGKVRGKGKVDGSLSPDVPQLIRERKPMAQIASLALPTPPRIAGSVDFSLPYLDNPSLPAAIKDLSGSVTVTNNSLKCHDVKAGMLDSTVSLSGELLGKPYFWSQTSQGKIGIAGNIDLSRAGEAAGQTTKKRAFFEHLRPEGTLAADLKIQGPLWEPSRLAATGDVEATSVSCRLDSPFAKGELRETRAKVHLLADRVVIDRVAGKMGTISVATSGTVTSIGWDMDLSLSGLLRDYQKAFPLLLSDSWTVGGKAKAALHLRGRLKSPPSDTNASRPFEALVKTLQFQPEKPGENGFTRAELDRRIDWDVTGVAHADDVTMTHIVLPAPLTHITGDFIIAHDTIRTVTPANLQWGSSRGRGDASLQWLPQGIGKSVLKGQFPSMALEEWFTNWGRDKHSPPEEPATWALMSPANFKAGIRSTEELKFILDVTINADRATFKHYRFDKTSTHFTFTHRGRPADSLEFDKINSNLYKGTAEGTVALLFIDRAQWQTDLSFRDVLCEQLLEDMRRKKSTVTGLLTGNVSLTGRAGKRETLAGGGSLALRNSRFLQDPIFAALGKVLSWAELSDVSFSNVQGKFGVKDNFVDILGWKLYGTLLQLEANGRAGLDGDLDLYIVYRFLGPLDKVMGRIPVLKAVPKIINQVGETLLKLHVGGTAKKPDVTIVPFSADELRLFKFEPMRRK